MKINKKLLYCVETSLKSAILSSMGSSEKKGRYFKGKFESVWANLIGKIMSSNSTDGVQIANFINSLDRQQKALSPPL